MGFESVGQRACFISIIVICSCLCFLGGLEWLWKRIWLEVFEGQVVRPQTPKRGLNWLVLLKTIVGLMMCSLFMAKPGGL